MLVILSAAFSTSSATKTGSRCTCKIFHFACPNVNVSIYNKMKIAPFTEDIFKFEYSAAGGSKGTARFTVNSDRRFRAGFCRIKVSHVPSFVLFQNSCNAQNKAVTHWSRLTVAITNVNVLVNAQTSGLNNDSIKRM